MNTVGELTRGIGAELYKFKRTFVLWFLILAPAFVPAINLIIFLNKGHEIVGAEDNPWELLLKFSVDPGNFLFPFFVMIVALFVNSIEHNSNTWKLIYTQPLSRFIVYISKVKVFLLMLFFSLMLFGVFTVLVGWILNIVKPDLGFDQAFDVTIFFLVSTKIFLTTLGYASLQFLMSQQWRNLMLPLGIGIAGLISFMILVQGWKYVEYHPYGYQILGLGNYLEPDYELWSEAKFVFRSLGLAVVVFLAGWIVMSKKRII